MRDRVLAARLALAVAVVTAVAGTALAAARADPAAALATALAGAAVVAAAGLVLLRQRGAPEPDVQLVGLVRRHRNRQGDRREEEDRPGGPAGPRPAPARCGQANRVPCPRALSCAALLAGLVPLLT
ncbi:hypothetical protein ACFV2Q_00250 [Streptomyces sp. NPDC059650]|uniref:hypothetical protein n=1 Tax=Streptomyces sp. NPDC059650 TaxID=3346896 RepID=UPI00368105EB